MLWMLKIAREVTVGGRSMNDGASGVALTLLLSACVVCTALNEPGVVLPNSRGIDDDEDPSIIIVFRML